MAGKENVFTRKLGPLPAWAWMAVAAALVLLIVVYEYRKNGSGTGSTSSASVPNTTPPTVFQVYPPESEPSGEDSDGPDSDDPSKPKPKKPKAPAPKSKHPKAFHIKKGQHSPTTRHGDKVWVHGHYGPHGAYHPGHWSGSGAVPQAHGRHKPHHMHPGKK